MTDQIQTLREDLAFMREVASDDGRMSPLVGAHFLAAGVIYGLPIVPVWATLRGYLDLPGPWTSQVSLWSTAVYLPVMAVLIWRGRGEAKPGPSARIFAAAWSGMGLTTFSILAVIFTAQVKLHEPQMWQLWTAICFSLYGAAWWGVSLTPGKGRWRWVAVGSYATAVVNGLLIGGPDVLLGCAFGILAWLAGPGLVIMLRAKARA